MHFTSAITALIPSFLLLGDVNAVALPSKSVTKRTEGGDKCFDWGETTCNGAGDMVLRCLGPPGGDLEFGGILTCIPGFQICVDGGCELDPNRNKPTPEPTETETVVPQPTDADFAAFLGEALFSGS
ncbi:hypothetical protein V8F06_012964, partial [Rhypophila decipiens]